MHCCTLALLHCCTAALLHCCYCAFLWKREVSFNPEKRAQNLGWVWGCLEICAVASSRFNYPQETDRLKPQPTIKTCWSVERIRDGSQPGINPMNCLRACIYKFVNTSWGHCCSVGKASLQWGASKLTWVRFLVTAYQVGKNSIYEMNMEVSAWFGK